MHQHRTVKARITQIEPLQVVCLDLEEWNLIRRLRDLRAKRSQMAIVEFSERGLCCREVGRREG